MTRAYHSWTPAEIAQLEAAAGSGKGALQAAAAAIGVTPGRAYQALYRARGRRRTRNRGHSPEDIAACAAELRAGASVWTVAHERGLTEGAMGNALRRHGVSPAAIKRKRKGSCP